jgi:hypothetical protein
MSVLNHDSAALAASEGDPGRGIECDDGLRRAAFVENSCAGDLTLNLQADRSGNGIGRIYTITVQCKDPFNNASIKTVTVRVPHDQGK